MILHDPVVAMDFPSYGIGIPVLDSRATRTVEALRQGAMNRVPTAEWLASPASNLVRREDLERVHDAAYVADLFSNRLERRILEAYELVLEDGSLHRYDPSRAVKPLLSLFESVMLQLSGSFDCVRKALSRGFCYFLGGGMHHAMPDRGAGFCLLNDIVVAARKAQHELGVRQVWIIDVDAHKGDGTAVLTQDDPSITTFSIHMAQGWPLCLPETLPDGSANPSFMPGDVDIGIPEGGEGTYLAHLREGLLALAAGPRADLAIVVDGADPWEGDALPSADLLKLTMDQVSERDRMIEAFLRERSIPQAWLMAGGYGPDSWQVYDRFLEQALPRWIGHAPR